MNPKRISNLMQEFLHLESASGLILITMLALAMVLANSPLSGWYDALLETPIFAFANAGVSLAGISLSTLLSSVPLGIALGLFLGKQAGVFVFSWLGIKMGLAQLPDRSSWWQLYGTAVLCGIGFTMSLFIGSLAFEHGGLDYATSARLGILVGSFLSAVTGYIILRVT